MHVVSMYIDLFTVIRRGISGLIGAINFKTQLVKLSSFLNLSIKLV